MKFTTKTIRVIFLFISAIMAFSAMAETTPAFPGAEGHGRYTTGGRDGKVYKVTTLEDTGRLGSLRYAISQKGIRTIVFDVSGTIHLKSALKITNDDITIAGQTAPGDGICLTDYPVTISANNVIIRYIRFRLGDDFAQESDGLGGMDKKHIIIDHCSVSWSTDECLSVYGCDSITVQWCIISQSLRESVHEKGTHGYGAIWGGVKSSYHHNLIAHHDSRTPRFGSRPGTVCREVVDMRNNVIYNWAGHGCYGGEGMNINIVNNYYKPGPATAKASSQVKYRIAKFGVTTTSACISSVNGNDTIWNAWKPKHHLWGKYFIDGNVMEGNSAVTDDNWTKGIYEQIVNKECDYLYNDAVKDSIRLIKPLTTDYITTHSAKMAFDRVMDYVGASLSRDTLDAVMISDTKNKTATYGNSGGYPGLINTPSDVMPVDAPSDWTPLPQLMSKVAKQDTDGDGIPDSWEEANDMDINDPADANLKNKDGYTYLELYINGLVRHITSGQNAGGEVLEDTGLTDSLTRKIYDNDLNEVYVHTEKGRVCIKRLNLNTDIQIYNMYGGLIKAESAQGKEIYISLPAGAYIVRVSSGINVRTFKILNI